MIHRLFVKCLKQAIQTWTNLSLHSTQWESVSGVGYAYPRQTDRQTEREKQGEKERVWRCMCVEDVRKYHY